MKRIEVPDPKHKLIHIALVDDEDYERLAKYRWTVTKKGYANGWLGMMHRVINQTPDGKLTDHLSSWKMDNRKINLRTASPSENSWNKGLGKNNTSGYRGVRQAVNGHWSARIWNGGVGIDLGIFTNAYDAVAAYNAKAKELRGDFAFLNSLPYNPHFDDRTENAASDRTSVEARP